MVLLYVEVGCVYGLIETPTLLEGVSKGREYGMYNFGECKMIRGTSTQSKVFLPIHGVWSECNQNRIYFLNSLSKIETVYSTRK